MGKAVSKIGYQQGSKPISGGNQSAKNKVLVLVCSEDHVSASLPIINELQTRNNVMVIGLEDMAQRALDRLGIAHKIPEDYTTDNTYEGLETKPTSLARKWHQINPEIKELVTYDGIDLGSLLDFGFSFYLVKVMAYIELMKLIFEKEKPDQLIVMDDGLKQPDRIMQGVNEYLVMKVAGMTAKSRSVPVSSIPIPMPIRSKPPIRWRRTLGLPLVKLFFKTLNIVHGFKPKRGKKNRILMVVPWVYGGSTAIELKKNKGNELIFFSYGDIPPLDWERLKEFRFGALYKSLGDYTTKKIDKEVADISSSFKERWHTLKSDSSFQQFMTYLGIPLWDLAEDRFSHVFTTKLAQMVRNIEIIRYLLDAEKIDIIVVANDVSEFDKTLVTVGNQKGIPSLVLQHGGHPTTLFTAGFLPLIATKHAVFGEIARDWFLKERVSPDRIAVTGCPRFDAYHRRLDTQLARNQVCKQLNLDAKKGLIVLEFEKYLRDAGIERVHMSHLEQVQLLTSVTSAMREFPTHQLVIKMNRAETAQRTALLRQLTGIDNMTNVRTVRDINLRLLLNACDLMITGSSTLGVEAMNCGKPIFAISLANRKMPATFAELVSVPLITREEQIVPLITKILNDSQYRENLLKSGREAVYKYCYNKDGKASYRVAKLIEKMIDESRH